MTPQEHIKAAIRTESAPEKALERIHHLTPSETTLLKNTLQDVAQILNDLDKWKKFIFYGKPLPNELTPQGKVFAQPLQSPTIEFTIQEMRLFHGVVGLLTEGCELLEALQKVIAGHDLDVVNVKEEMGDTEYYKSLIYDVIQADPSEVMDRNIAKLKARYPDKFSEERAIHRNIEVERKILEQ